MRKARNPFTVPLTSLTVLVFAAWQGFGFLMATPAFNQHLQIEGVGGRTRPILTRAMYDPADYLYQTSYAYAHSAAQTLLRGGVLNFFSIKAMKENNLAARSYAEKSLRHNPANAHAWMIVATTRRAAGQYAEAQFAYENATELAPYSASLAFPRLLFVAGDRSGNALSAFTREAVERDLLVLETYRSATFRLVQKRYPDLIDANASAFGVSKD